MANNVSCRITLNRLALKKIRQAQITALEKTAEFVHTDVVQSQTIPFDDPDVETYKVYGKRGQYKKDGTEYKGRTQKRKVARGGTLQNEKHFVYLHLSRLGYVSINVEGPYARRLYFHPEYNFDKGENPHAGGKWFEPYKAGGKKNDKVKKAYNEFYKRESGV